MGLHYSHLDLAERRQIQDLVAAGVPVAVIARRLGRHRSTVHREIGRNFHHTSFRDRWGKDYRGYYCLPADDSARRRWGRQAKLTRRGDLREHVVGKLRSGADGSAESRAVVRFPPGVALNGGRRRWRTGTCSGTGKEIWSFLPAPLEQAT